MPAYHQDYLSGRKRPPPGLRVWLSAGTYEGDIYGETRAVEQYFAQAGLKTRGKYTHEGHSFGTWRNVAGDMLRYFFRGAK